jgi:hypothetical protein
MSGRGSPCGSALVEPERREAKLALEAEAKAAAEAQSKARAEAEDQRRAAGGKKTRKPPAPPKAEPSGKAQRNFTDPESRILKTQDGSIQGYNAQAAVDGAHQIIVAQTLTRSSSDQAQLAPLLDGIRANLGTNPDEVSADAGYCSDANLRTIKRRRIEGYIATGRQKHGTKSATAKKGFKIRIADRQDEHQAQPRRPPKPLPIAQADRRAGVRTDQTGKRIQAIPAARHRKGQRRMGPDLHRSQPRQAGKGRMSTSPIINHHNVQPTQTGS